MKDKKWKEKEKREGKKKKKMGTGVRVRLRFEESEILSSSQKSEGLNRCWFQVSQNEITSISDFASLLLHKFSLHHSCPNGLLLFMDGYVLPQFESTCIFKDSDIIRIKRKTDPLLDNGANHIEEPEIMEKQPLLSAVKPIAIEGSVKEAENKHEVPSADALELRAKKKRKHLDDHDGLKGLINYCPALGKRRKTKSASEELVIADEVEKVPEAKQNGKLHRKKGLSKKKIHKKSKESVAVVSTEVNEENIGSEPSADCDQLQRNGQTSRETSNMLDGTKKLPSRSARRKKAKRKWLRELAKTQNKELPQEQVPEKDIHKKSSAPQQLDQSTDKADEIVAVKIRPGHIRFRSLDEDAEQSNYESRGPVETFQWIGTTSKKKGQKWGIEKASIRRNIDEVVGEVSSEKSNDTHAQRLHVPGDFEKLECLSGKPKEGDVIAYRLVELSSSWCPELSSFRVGKVSNYDPFSEKSILVPVPEYPIVLDEKKDEASELLSSASLYGEDGSLEIDFASLVDVRIISRNKADATTEMNENHEAPGINQETGANKEFNHNAVADGQVNPWDAISEALSEKKTQLMQKNGFDNKESSAKRPWSYRAMRSSALGPTMALLRAQNDLGE